MKMGIGFKCDATIRHFSGNVPRLDPSLTGVLKSKATAGFFAISN